MAHSYWKPRCVINSSLCHSFDCCELDIYGYYDTKSKQTVERSGTKLVNKACRLIKIPKKWERPNFFSIFQVFRSNVIFKMASQNDSRHNFEVRKLEYLHKQTLGHFLDQSDCWKRLMDVIPMTFRPVRSPEKRFNNDDIW